MPGLNLGLAVALLVLVRAPLAAVIARKETPPPWSSLVGGLVVATAMDLGLWLWVGPEVYQPVIGYALSSAMIICVLDGLVLHFVGKVDRLGLAMSAAFAANAALVAAAWALEEFAGVLIVRGALF